MKLWQEIKNIEGTEKQLRSFAKVMGVFFLIIFVVGLRHPTYFLVGVSAGFFLMGFVAPKTLAPIYKIWMGLAFVMGWVMTHVILTVIFFLVITPIALVLKLMGKHFLNMRFKDGSASYWLDHAKNPSDKSAYENQF